MTIKFNVSGQIITRIDNNVPVADSRRYIDFEFEFSPEWDGVNKTAVISVGNSSPYYILVTDDKINAESLPVFTAGEWKVAVFGGDLITSNSAPVMFVPSGLKDGKTPAEPPEDIYGQILSLAMEAKETADSVRSDADSGLFDGKDGEASAEYIAIGEQVASNASQVALDKGIVGGYKNEVADAKTVILAKVAEAEGYKNNAQERAGVATEQANIAKIQADIATSKANTATEKLNQINAKAAEVAENTSEVVLKATQVAGNTATVVQKAAEVESDRAEVAANKLVVDNHAAVVEANKDIVVNKTADLNSKVSTVISKAAEVANNAGKVAADKGVVAADKAVVVSKAAEALQSALNALASEENAHTSAGNAKESETSALGAMGVAVQAMTDLLAMMGEDIATLTDGKLTPSQIPDLSINDVFEVADTDEMLTLTAQRGDCALIIPDDVVTDSYILSADDASVLANWKKLGVSYVANAGHAVTSDNAENASKINNKRLVAMTESQYEVAVKDESTFYAVVPDEE